MRSSNESKPFYDFVPVEGTNLMVSNGTKLDASEANDLTFNCRQGQHGRVGARLFFKHDNKKCDIVKQALYMQAMHEKLPDVVPGIEAMVFDSTERNVIGYLMPFIEGQRLTKSLGSNNRQAKLRVANAFMDNIVLGLLQHGVHGDFSTNNMIVSDHRHKIRITAVDLIDKEDGLKVTDRNDEIFMSAEVLVKLGVDSVRFLRRLQSIKDYDDCSIVPLLMAGMEDIYV